MGMQEPADKGPDLGQGIELADFGGGRLLRGHVGKEAVVLARVGDEVLAVGARCTHYGGALDRGLLDGETLRCPLHHACFSLRTGEALAPAFDPLPCWRVEQRDGRYFVREKLPPAPSAPLAAAGPMPARIVIIGGGAAGFAAAEMLRRRGWEGQLSLLSAEADPPCDRPNLSKDYLAGNAPEDWIPLRGTGFYAERKIDLHLGTVVERIDAAAHAVVTADGSRHPYDRLLIATGAEPVRLPIPGADLPHVRVLRSLADSREIIARAGTTGTAVVLGTGFIGLEVAASLRSRGLAVHLVSLDERPLERVLGRQLGEFIRGVHEGHGEVFHMGNSIARIDPDAVTLSDGTVIPAGLVVIGVGVRPRVQLAEAAGLAIDRGIVVDEQLRSSVPDIYAAGDVARWPCRGESARIEHWVVAERQGQVAALNMLGAGQPYRDVPFFWSEHHEVSIRYVGHALTWDHIEVEGDINAGNCAVRYLKDGRTLALATIGRDLAALEEARRLAASP